MEIAGKERGASQEQSPEWIFWTLWESVERRIERDTEGHVHRWCCCSFTTTAIVQQEIQITLHPEYGKGHQIIP